MDEFEPGKRSAAEYPPILELRADACVIGAGAGGSAGAAAMAEAGLSVVVLEAGRHWKPGDFRPSSPFALSKLYQEGGTRAATGNGLIMVNGGLGVGGSTLINSAICFKTPEPILADWRENHGCHTLESGRFGALLDRVWTTIGAVKNPAQVQRNNNLIFKKGAEALGLKGDFMYRSAPGCTGCGVCNMGCPTGGKLSVDRTFLAQALGTGRVGVYASCRAEDVEFSGSRITAVVGATVDPDTNEPVGRFRVRADRFLLSGGPVGTPRFLGGNGLSTSEHCGQHLHLHPAVGVFGVFPFDINPWSGVTQGYYVDAWEEGYLLQTCNVPPDQMVIGMPIDPEQQIAIAARMRQTASAGALIHDEDSSGSVGNAMLTYWLGDGDRRRLIEGLRACARVYFAAGAEQVVTAAVGVGVIRAPSEIDDKLSLDIPARELLMIASHPMGTCRMGGDPERSVVDPRGRVWAWDNLHVADASMFPSSLGVNPQVTVMALGLLVGQEMAT